MSNQYQDDDNSSSAWDEQRGQDSGLAAQQPPFKFTAVIIGTFVDIGGTVVTSALSSYDFRVEGV